jgi:hypothetical protein
MNEILYSVGDMVIAKHKYKFDTYRYGFIQSIVPSGREFDYYYVYFFENQKVELKGYYDLKRANVA